MMFEEEKKQIEKAVDEYISREGFITRAAVPQSFFDDIASEGIPPENAFLVYAEIRDRLGNLSLVYNFACHDALMDTN